MAGKTFELTEETLSIIEEIGGHMPGGFFIYKAAEPEELIYANKPVFDIYGCSDLDEFKALTGFTFREECGLSVKAADENRCAGTYNPSRPGREQ